MGMSGAALASAWRDGGAVSAGLPADTYITGYPQLASEQARARGNSRFEGTTALGRAAVQAQGEFSSSFAPMEEQLRRTAMGRDAGEVVSGIRQQGDLAAQSADVSSGALDRERAGLGLGAAGQSVVQRLGLRRTLAQVDAQNRSSTSAFNQQREAQQWATQQWGTDRADSVSMLSRIAQSENDRMNQFKGAKEARRQGIIGLGAQGAGLAIGAIAMSDRRLKRDIEHVGFTSGGNKLYSFRYLWSESRHVGVMSDEVRHIPGAVISGMFDRVDYSKVA